MQENEPENKKTLVIVAILAAIAGAIITLAIVAHPDMDDDDDEERVATAIEGSSSTAVDLGTLAAENGIEVAPLATSSGPGADAAFGTIADVTELIDLVRRDDTLAAGIAGLSAKADASAAEEERLAQLNADDRNASDRALELARAEAASDRAALESSRTERTNLRMSARRRWGALAEGILDGNRRYLNALEGRSTLIEVAIRAETEAPEHLQISAPGHDTVEADLVGPSAQVDPQLQQRIHYYLASSVALPAGLRVTASLPNGFVDEGVNVPRSAVVWSEGSAWVFVDTASGRFERRRVGATRLSEDGYFETALPAGTRVVIRGAQQLLSQQHKPEPED